MPITNSLAFLFAVLGDWYVDRKVISRGMFCHNAIIDIAIIDTGNRYLVRDGVILGWDRAMRPKQEQVMSDDLHIHRFGAPA